MLSFISTLSRTLQWRDSSLPSFHGFLDIFEPMHDLTYYGTFF